MVEQHPNTDLYRVPGHESWNLTWNDLKPGAMYWDTRFDPGERLSVKLPNNAEWLIDRRPPIWTRTGEPPNITVTPSINHQGQYHGHLSAGILTEDVEGRTFTQGT
jgi:hypothetical protein